VTTLVLARLLGIVSIVALGYLAARTRALGSDDAAQVLSNLAFTIFTPALLFRTTALVDLTTLPWVTLAAFFIPVLVALGVVRLVGQFFRRDDDPPGAPAVRAISVTFGNTVQVGIPVILALYGPEALRLHIAIVSLHALTILTVITAVMELDLARDAARRHAGGRPDLVRTVASTARNTVVHPVVLPVLAGLAANLGGANRCTWWCWRPPCRWAAMRCFSPSATARWRARRAPRSCCPPRSTRSPCRYGWRC
jgi:malonate transporter